MPSAFAQASLRIEVIAAYNLVVDSNVESPSTYAPRAAYLGATYHNDGTNPLTDVWAYIGDYTAGTPGTYPSRAHPPLDGPLPGDEFALTHEGGALGTADATRYLGTIDPGESVTVYWLVSYPNVDDNGDAVWGPSVKPDDDLWLEYDVWGTARDGAAPLEAVESRTVTMRNEISAMANKIFPNGANKVPDEYKALLEIYTPSWTNTAEDGTPGTLISTEGIWYDLGNVGAGFDNNGDLIPDRNAWLQPVGDADLFDPSCFRLVHTYALVIVKLNDGTERIYNVEDQLYFENIPENNNGAVGYVRYEFLSLRGGCSSTLTPYQEVASGDDNEKFNGDYGATLGQGLSSGTTAVQIAKSASPASTVAGGTVNYAIGFTNAGTVAVGHPEIFLPLVVQDSIPTGTVYVAGSATNANVLPAGVTNYTVYYSTNHGGSWTTTEPAAAANVTDLQWWLSGSFEPGTTGLVGFAVAVDSPYTNASPVVPNVAGLSLGGAIPFLTDEASTLVQGVNALGDTVWRDDGTGGGWLGNQAQDGSEAGLAGVAVRLYYDLDTNGVVDGADFLLALTNTDAAGTYVFTNLPDGQYVVQVEALDADIPFGFTPTTPTNCSLALDAARTNANAVTNLTADFGFAPALTLTKALASTNAFREGQYATYTLTVSNSLPGDGSGNGSPASYYAWATSGVAGATEWINYPAVYTPPGPDGIHASNKFSAASKTFVLSNFPVGVQVGGISNVSLLLPIVTSPNLTPSGTLQVDVQRRSPAATMYSSVYSITSLVSGTWTIPMTGTFAWTWADFATNYTVTLTANKGGGAAGTGYLQLDAVGFKILGTELTGEASGTTTLDPVPLTDQYDADLMQYVGAVPAPASATTNGTAPDSVGSLYWGDIGPIYPGGTSTVAVTFKLLEPPNSAETESANTVWTTNAQIQAGLPVNAATSTATEILLPAATLGNYVWRDLNGDGVQNETNMGIASVAVSLTPPAGIDLGSGAGVPVTNWTDAAGYYLFESIPATGVYTVRVVAATLPGGAGASTYDESGAYDGVAAVYLDPAAAPGHTNNVHLTADFGYQTQTTIEGTIWHDWDRGAETNRESGEDWLTNVVVYLCASPSPCGPGASLATNATATNGSFRFVGSYTGAYTILVATNTGMMTNRAWNLSWDTDGTSSVSHVSVTVASGGVARADFSYWQAGDYTIGDTLYYDWDGNGIQSNAFEEGVADVTVYLYEDANSNGVVDTGADAFIASATTASNGYYAFTNLFATNTYLVYVDPNDPDLPENYLVTGDPYGTMDARSVVTLTNASNYLQDFGFQPSGGGSIGDTVWKDMDADGAQSGMQETGISNVLVSLYVDFNNDGTYVLLRTTNTGSAGAYLFGSLPDGEYRVVVDPADADLPADAFGNAYYPSTAVSRDVTISGGSAYLDADFGFAPYGAIGDTVFWDANRNGTQDYSEDGVSGVVVRLYYDANANGAYDVGETLAASATTDVAGAYLFEGLLPTNYAVRIVTTNGPLFGVSPSADPDSDGYACADTNNAVPCDDQYGLDLGNGQNFMGADFGYAPPGVIGDLLWVDTNTNGVQDAGESGLPYVSVVLYSNGTAIATNETDADGYYYFSGLPDGTYGVQVATGDADFPAGLTNVWTADGTFDDYATNIVISGGTVVSVGGLPCTGCDLSIDFGYRYAGNNSLSGTIGYDAGPFDGVLNGTNASGVATNESAYAGVSVYLYLWNDDGDGIVEAGEYAAIASTATGTNGDYSFAGLPNGDGDDRYIAASSAPEDYLKLTTTNGSISGVGVVETTNASGNTVSAYLTVNVAPAITGMDFAYRSTKNYDYGDLPESYQTLLPGGARHVVATSNLYLGSTVDVEGNGQPSAAADGDDLAGTDDEDGVQLDGVWQDGVAGGMLQVAVGQGSGWLIGFIDFNADGDFADAGEMVVHQEVSDAGGPDSDGAYPVSVDVPVGTINAATTTALNARFRLLSEDPFVPELAFSGTAENGEVEDYVWDLLGSIGDYIWEDLDGDGTQDAGEPPIPGVRVFIDLDTDGQWQTSEPCATTDTNGLYYIGGLTPDTYSARVDTNTLEVGLVPTWDRDGTGSRHVASVTLSQGEAIRDVDFGYATALSDLAVWKTVDAAIVDEGSNVAFTVTVTNLGPDAVDVLALGDLLPAGLTFVSSSPSQGSYDSGTGEWNVGALAVSGGASLSIIAAAAAGTGGTTLTNVASLSGSDPVDPQPSNNVASAAVTVRGADLAVSKNASNLRPDEGDPVTYRVAVTNLGPSDTTGVSLSDLLPAGVTYVSNLTSQGSYDNGAGTWTVGALAAGSNAWLDIFVTVDFGTLGTIITNSAAVAAQDLPDPVATNDSALVRIYVPPLVLYKTADTNLVEFGGTITYTITATNIGPWVHTNVVIHDPLPAGTIYVPGSITFTSFPPRADTVESARDEFAAQAYTNQDGAWPWTGAWQEEGESDGASAGYAQVLTNGWASLGQTRALARAVDISSAESAEFSFSLRQATVTRTNNIRDEFNAAAYTNNNGTLAWTGNWVETGDDLSAAAGDILVSGGVLSFSGLEANDEVGRWAKYAGNTNATLTFDYAGSGLTATRSMNVYILSNATEFLLASYTAAGSGTATFDLTPYLGASASSSNRIVFRAGGTDWASQSFTVDNVNIALERPMQTTLDYAYVQVSTNGSDWTTLLSTNGNIGGTLATNFDLAAWRSTQTWVRFRTTGYTNTGAQLWFDDVDVETVKEPGTDEVGEPPDLLSGWTMGTSEAVRITYQVAVDDTLFTTQVVNTASASSDLQPDAVTSVVTTAVDLVGAQLGDFTWVDSDYDGQQDAGEPALSNVVVTLCNASSNILGVTTSSASGAYAFTNLVPGSYFVSFAPPAGYRFTVSNAGGDATDSDPMADTNRTALVTLIDGQVDDTLDAGFYLPASVGDYTWEDSDGDGQQDAGEPALSNVVVTLYDAVSNVVGVATSSAAGAYAFTNLVPGTYAVGFAPPSGYLFTTSNVGDDATDSDALAATERTGGFTLASGQTDQTADAGFYRLATVGDRVWYDASHDGIQDAGETNGFADLPVSLMRTNDTVVQTVVTDGAGQYLFTNVAPGTYYVRWDLTNLPPAVGVTLYHSGSGDVDSDGITNGTGEYAVTTPVAIQGAQTNLDLDLGIAPMGTTRAEVAEVWGEWTEGEGRVAWRTSSEWNTAGFLVYRVDPETGMETRLDDKLVPAAFNEAGAVYELADPEAAEGDERTYRLEEIELSGAALDLGIHVATFAAPPAAARKAQASARASKAVLEPSRLAVPKAQGPSAMLKATLREEGIYGISLQAIAAGMGISFEEAQVLAAGNRLAVSEQGVPVPLFYDETRARLVFHGKPTDNWYTRDNVLLISAGEGRAMARREPGAASGESVFPATVRFEVDKYPFDSSVVKPEDFYYWEYVISGTNASATRSFALDLAGRTGDVALNVRLMGWSSTTNDPDHLAEFRVNGQLLGSVTFDGQDAVETRLSVPLALVSNGWNTLSVKGVLQPGRTHSYFVVDWIEASFERELALLSGGTAHFLAGGAEAVSAAAFAEPVALALDEAGTPAWIADGNGALPSRAWAVESPEERFAVAEADAIPMLEPEAVVADPWFLSETNRIDYLVLTSRTLEPAARELADYRAGQGLRTGVATFEDVCDWMTGGLRTPEAVPALLAHAASAWKESPWMVVLAGNGHYDYLGALSNEMNHLPPMLLQTQDGIFSADGQLSDVDGDGLPDIAIGRLPARTTNELAAMVAKIRAFEAEFGSDWQNQMVLVADTNDASAGDFAAANEKLASLAGADRPVARIDLNATPVAAAKTGLTNWFKTGAGFIHYTGHGGVNSWSPKKLLLATDVNAMTNARKPAVVALSCLVGRFEAPGVDSIGELLMRRAQGGATAVWGPSGLSRNDPAVELGEVFYRAVLQEGAGTLGMAILQARRSLQGNLFTKDTFDIYNLLGDPALRIAGNLAGQPSDANFAQWRWQRFSPGELADPQISGATDANFFEYAMDGGHPVEAELPEFGYPLPAEEDEPGFILRWKRRVRRSDIEYQLLLSRDLTSWEADSPDLETVGIEPDPDGVMETVRTKIKRPNEMRVFIGIQARKK